MRIFVAKTSQHSAMTDYTLAHYLLLYLAGINGVACCVFGIDKWKAKRHKWRIPEATLLLLALAGGSLGAWVAMHLFRHKTQHRLFAYGIPTIIILQILLTGYAYYKIMMV